ncbi:hypothetical protein AX14_014294 [Amanita brunnescens Koide BX004]|nr:hypothetical protein AX14_014294 [Amanita brunnescens Koide BX004]
MSRCAAPHRNRSRAFEDPGYEDRIRAAVEGLGNKTYVSIREAARKEQVSYSTLQDRLRNRHKPYKV